MTTNTTCDHILTGEYTDLVCIAPASHAGDCEYVDAMGLDAVVDGQPVYRAPFNHAR